MFNANSGRNRARPLLSRIPTLNGLPPPSSPPYCRNPAFLLVIARLFEEPTVLCLPSVFPLLSRRMGHFISFPHGSQCRQILEQIGADSPFDPSISKPLRRANSRCAHKPWEWLFHMTIRQQRGKEFLLQLRLWLLAVRERGRGEHTCCGLR